MRITFENTTDFLGKKRKIVYEEDSDQQTLVDMLEILETLLRAWGYVFDGQLDIVNYNLEIKETNDE